MTSKPFAVEVPHGLRQLHVGGRLAGELAEDRHEAVCVDVSGLPRGALLLDVRLTAVPPGDAAAGGGLFLCVAKSGSIPDIGVRNFHWASPVTCPGEVGWRCRIQPHRWLYANSGAAVLLAFSSRPPPRPLWCAGHVSCVGFEVLPGAPPPAGPAASFEASLSFESELSCMPTAGLRDAHAAFHAAYDGVDGIRLSHAGQSALNRKDDTELTYGEVQFRPFQRTLESAAAPRAGEVFVDLGSGTGRALVAASLGFPSLAACVGYEVVPHLHWAAERAAASLEATAHAPIRLREADFLECAWEEEADIVWVSSLCMSRSTLEAVEERARSLKPGARVITMDRHFGTNCEEFEPQLLDGEPGRLVEMSFGDGTIYVLKRK